MVRIGIVGIGFMGMIHYQAAKRLKEAKVTAIATRDKKKLAGDWTSIQGNFGPRGQQEDLSGVHCHAEVADLLADPDVDLVDVCLPNDLHAETVIKALNAGKHVLVEKAIALSIADADRMLAAAAKAGKLLMVAHVLPFFADFRFALDAVKSGRYGALKAAHFRRHISPPDWSSAMKDLARMGGPIVDLHIHDTHFVGLLCGKPRQVYSRGLVREGSVEYVSTQYLFDGAGPIVTATSGALSQSSRPFTHGYEIYLERATIHYEAGNDLVVYSPSGVEKPALGGGDPIDSFAAELELAVDAVKKNQAPDLLSGQLARDALALCLTEEASVKSGKVMDVV